MLKAYIFAFHTMFTHLFCDLLLIPGNLGDLNCIKYFLLYLKLSVKKSSTRNLWLIMLFHSFSSLAKEKSFYTFLKTYHVSFSKAPCRNLINHLVQWFLKLVIILVTWETLKKTCTDSRASSWTWIRLSESRAQESVSPEVSLVLSLENSDLAHSHHIVIIMNPNCFCRWRNQHPRGSQRTCPRSWVKGRSWGLRSWALVPCSVSTICRWHFLCLTRDLLFTFLNIMRSFQE